MADHDKSSVERDRLLERYRAMTEEASDIITMHEGEGIVFASDALQRTLGRSAAQFQNGRYLDFVHPDDMDEALKVRGRPGPGEMWTGTYRIRHADGHYLWFEVTTRALYDASGAFVREVSVGRNITERKEYELAMRAAQEKAEAANRAKTLFLANMSHELRTPLNAIIGFGDIMRQQMFGELGPRYTDYATQIHESGKRLLSVISDLLDMVQIESGRRTMDFQPLDLGTAVEDCVNGFREQAQVRGVTLTAEACAAPLTADRRAVKQIIDHLLSNALKCTNSGGHVSVAAHAMKGGVEVVVRDDGVGIPADAVQRLGKAFEQVSTDPRVTKNGAGLGLALVRALADKHGGTVSIESELGVGTTVTVVFPSEPARAVA